MPLFINSLVAGTNTHTQTHTDLYTESVLRYQAPQLSLKMYV